MDRVAELQSYVDFAPSDAQYLAKLHGLIAPDFPRIALEFYEKIREHEEAHAILAGEEQIARLQASLQRWMHRVFGGTYDAAYYAQTEKIGEVHVRVGLPQRYMFTAMALFRLEIARLIDERAAPGDAGPMRAALHKALDLELTVMLEAYGTGHLERLHRLQQIEKDELAESLALTEHRYMVAVELAQDLIVGLDRSGTVRLFNAGAEHVSGYGREEVLGASFADLLLAPESRDAFRAALDASADDPESGRRTVEAVLRTRSGKLREVRWEVAHTPMASGDVEAFVIGHDRTDETALAERTRQSERLAAVGMLAAGLAHEIRNPLNGAQLHVSYLARTLAKSGANGEVLEAVAVVGQEIKRLAQLVTEFLDFARPKPLAKAEVLFAPVCERVIQLAMPAAQAAHVTITCDAPHKELLVSIDPGKIEQVLLNLVQNAVEALAPVGGGRVTLRARRQPRNFVVEVEDDGPGLPAPDTPIFDAFYSTKAEGTGLGLAITHRIVTDHDGLIDVESRPGRTIFRITLPLAHVGRIEGTS